MKQAVKKAVKKAVKSRKPLVKSPARRGMATTWSPAALVLTAPVGNPKPFSTKASQSGNHRGSSTTTGLRGTIQTLDDGTVVIEATEDLTAKRTDGLNAKLTASCRRVTKGDTTIVHQVNYSYKQRVLADSTLVTGVTGLALPVPQGFQASAVRTVKATQFGKNDHQDEGTASPDMGLIQTNSEVFGGSVKVSVMVQLFGTAWRQNSKRLGAMIDVLFPDRKTMVRVPLVDVGPAENAPSHAEVDLTWASDQFLGTQGGATVQYRIVLPQ